jgi:hypothetical protein
VADLKAHSVAAETETTEAVAKDVTITAVVVIVAEEAQVKVVLEQEEITEAEILLTEVLVNN